MASAERVPSHGPHHAPETAPAAPPAEPAAPVAPEAVPADQTEATAAETHAPPAVANDQPVDINEVRRRKKGKEAKPEAAKIEKAKRNLNAHAKGWGANAPGAMVGGVGAASAVATGKLMMASAANANADVLIGGYKFISPIAIKLAPFFAFFGMASLLHWIEKKWLVKGGGSSHSAAKPAASGGGGHDHH